VRHAENALRQFEESGTGYDVAHARFTLAEASAANNAHRRAVEEGGEARLQLVRKDYGLLSTLFPERAFPYVDRIAAGLLGYAYGDAVGLPWEGKPPAEIDMAQVPSLPSRPEWPKGATSDDTALTLLVAEHLVDSGRADGAAFLELLAERAPSIKGLGPSTTAAIEHYRRTGRAPEGNGNTNGALMRSLPVGWALPFACAQDRRAWTVEVSRATHPGAEACCAALVGSACAAWAIEQAEPSLLLEIALEEAAAAQEAYRFDGRLHELLTALESGRWEPDHEATELDSYETLARVLWCVLNESRLTEAMLLAVRFGGDTDTVAALVGGLLGCRLTPDAVGTQVPWSGDVRAPADAEMGQLAAGLAALRTGAPPG
jgi:ADP-ribosyl-[dinitrogen reductase] hydrolase